MSWCNADAIETRESVNPSFRVRLVTAIDQIQRAASGMMRRDLSAQLKSRHQPRRDEGRACVDRVSRSESYRGAGTFDVVGLGSSQ